MPGPGDPRGSGTARVTLDLDRGEICFDLAVIGIAPATAARIHEGPAGRAGRGMITLMPPIGGSSSGCVSAARDDLAALLGDPERYYVAVRTADFLLQVGSRIGVARVDRDGRAQASRQRELLVVHVHRRDVQPHRLRVLHRHVAQSADAGNHGFDTVSGHGLRDEVRVDAVDRRLIHVPQDGGPLRKQSVRVNAQRVVRSAEALRYRTGEMFFAVRRLVEHHGKGMEIRSLIGGGRNQSS